MWLGPAPVVPYRPNLLHAVWRWWFAFGTGDMGNDGVHDLDIARWGLGVTTHPNKVSGLGKISCIPKRDEGIIIDRQDDASENPGCCYCHKQRQDGCYSVLH